MQKRIVWVDIYKCLVILLVVVGHATGLFNNYIYQFHMAAFFFISGYVAKLQEKTFGEIVIQKFFTLFLPLITFVIGGSLFMGLITKTRFNGILFPKEFPGVGNSIKYFFESGDIYVQFLGACWFLFVLLGIFLLEKGILLACRNQYNIVYAIIVLLVYLFGYYLVEKGINFKIGFFQMDLICIGHLYFAIGGILSKIKARSFNAKVKTAFGIGVLLINVIVFWYFGNINLMVVDYPSRSFNNAILDAVAALNGIVFIFIIAFFLQKMPERLVKKVRYVGQNTMGIVVFHFLFFKLFSGILYKIGVVQIGEMVSVTPPVELGKQYWWLYSILSIVGSLVLWEIIKHIPILSFFVGCKKNAYKRAEKRIVNCRIWKGAREKATVLRKCLDEYEKKIVKCIKKAPFLVTCVTLLIVAVCIPLYKQGIMCNDELQTRYWSYQGFSTAYKHYFEEHILKGRALSTPIVSLTICLGFLGQSNWTFKILQIFSILLSACVFGVLIYKLFKK